MKKYAFVFILTAIIIAPLFAQIESNFRVAFTDDGSGVIVRRYSGTELQVTIPAMIQYMPVKEIGQEAFRSSNITSIVIPEGVTVIRENAFADCPALSSVTLPSTLISIEEFAFSNCASLSTIVFPNNLKLIGRNAFAESGLTSVSWTPNINIVSTRVFYNCKSLQSVTIPEGVEIISSFAFFGCSALTSVAFPVSLLRLNEGSFNSCTSLTTVTISDSVIKILFTEQEQYYISEIRSFLGCPNMSSASQTTLRRVGYTGDF